MDSENVTNQHTSSLSEKEHAKSMMKSGCTLSVVFGAASVAIGHIPSEQFLVTMTETLTGMGSFIFASAFGLGAYNYYHVSKELDALEQDYPALRAQDKHHTP